MWDESPEPNQKQTSKPKLRTGLTTGTCATACCVALAHYLLKGEMLAKVQVTLPRGEMVDLSVGVYQEVRSGVGRVETEKDAGDDPDVTHKAKIFVELELVDSDKNIVFKALSGVGKVTRPGLLLAVGEPAINPVPRKMMSEHLRLIAESIGYRGGFVVGVGIQNGEQIALKTMNPKLGIIGGLSILGTTGIVRPYSCGAWIASIYQSIDVASANGIQHIAASTGRSSEAAIKDRYTLNDLALVEMGDFVSAVLKHLKLIDNINKISICGGFGKITKLAQGHLNLHSRHSAVDFYALSELAAALGANRQLQQAIIEANTSIQVLDLCTEAGIDLVKPLCEKALSTVQSKISKRKQIEVWAINRQGQLIGSATGVGVQ